MNGDTKSIRGFSSIAGVLALAALLTAGVAANAAAGPGSAIEGAAWVPAGVEGVWSVPSWPHPLDIDWDDGKSQTGAAQPISHTYRRAGAYTIEASRFDVDSGKVILGTLEVSTQLPTMTGPFRSGTSTPISDLQVGQDADFVFTIPGSYFSLEYGNDGQWQNQSIGNLTFTTSFRTAGTHSAGIRLGAAGWSSSYSKTWSVTVSDPPTTTTVTTTIPTTTTLTTLTTAPVSSPGSDAPLTADPTTPTTLEPVATTTIPWQTTTTTENDDAAAVPLEGSPGDTEPLRRPDTPNKDRAYLWIGVLTIIVGVAGTAAFGYRFVSLREADEPEKVDIVRSGMSVQPDAAESPGVRDSHDKYTNRRSPFAKWLAGGAATASMAIAIFGIYTVSTGDFPALASPTPWTTTTSAHGFDIKPGTGSLEVPIDVPGQGPDEFSDPNLDGLNVSALCSDQISIPPDECIALGLIYGSGLEGSSPSGGPWFDAGSPCLWEGVGCRDGHVGTLSLAEASHPVAFPAAIRNLPALQVLICDSCGLTGALPGWLGELSKLEIVYLRWNSLSGEIPETLVGPSMREIYLTGNQLTGDVPESWGDRAPDLEELVLKSNQLTRRVLGIHKMQNLRHLNLSYNDLSGPLPRLPSSIEAIYLSSNRFTGSIWAESNAEVIVLDRNQLTGAIPGDPFSYRNWIDGWLETLFGLEEQIPITHEKVRLYSGLVYDYPRVDLSHNQLDGQVPSELAGFHGDVDISFNHLSGQIPYSKWFAGDFSAADRTYNGQTNCLTARDEKHAAALSKEDPLWNDGC